MEQLARSLGARALAEGAAAFMRELSSPSGPAHLEMRTLGAFRLRRDGKTLGPADWADERARALLKRLASGTTWTPAALARSISPRGGAEELDQAVAAARLVLDPEGRFPADHFVVVGSDLVQLRHVDVDVDLFLDEARRGLVDNGAAELLRAAEARYGGDFLEEHPSEHWAVPTREEARSRYVEISRALAADAVRTQDLEAAARYCRRILERDPYDEQAHHVLVSSLDLQGRYPEARRCYSTYVQRLDELGLEAVPWDQITKAVPV